MERRESSVGSVQSDLVQGFGPWECVCGVGPGGGRRLESHSDEHMVTWMEWPEGRPRF